MCSLNMHYTQEQILENKILNNFLTSKKNTFKLNNIIAKKNLLTKKSALYLKALT